MTADAVGTVVQPDDAYFDTMVDHVPTHWWYRSRLEWVRQELAAYPAGGRAFDVGCGAGATMQLLSELGYEGVAGADVSEYVLHRSPWTAQGRVMLADAARLPIADHALSCLTSMDVLEHLPDDRAAVREYARVLRPDGVLLVTTPSYRWLYSEHDRWAGHYRRYSAELLRSVVTGGGFIVDRVTHVFSFLVPGAMVLRRTPLRRLIGRTDEETSSPSAGVDRVLAALATAERKVGRGRKIPLGLSLLLVARRR